MFYAHVRFTGKRALPLVLVLGSLFLSNSAQAQFTRIGAVGGVKVDADGVISHPEAGDFRELKAAWQAGLQPVPPKLDTPAELPEPMTVAGEPLSALRASADEVARG